MGFHPWVKTIIIVIWSEIYLLLSHAEEFATFNDNYNITWGNDHVKVFNDGGEVQLSLDRYSGAGFASKEYYGSGFFQMRIKLPPGDSAGVVTAFYLNTNVGIHDELDFEFLGNRQGKPITLQTNVFANGVGGREQRIRLWFDPSADFHFYQLLWNQHQISFYVDGIPIRVYKNVKGVGFPRNPLQVVVSLWDGSNWATDGGKTKADWSKAPFQAHFQYFWIDDACRSSPKSPNKDCYSSRHPWNDRKYWQLNNEELRNLERVKRRFMTYDYCTDRARYPIPLPECR